MVFCDKITLPGIFEKVYRYIAAEQFDEYTIFQKAPAVVRELERHCIPHPVVDDIDFFIIDILLF